MLISLMSTYQNKNFQHCILAGNLLKIRTSCILISPSYLPPAAVAPEPDRSFFFWWLDSFDDGRTSCFANEPNGTNEREEKEGGGDWLEVAFLSSTFSARWLSN